MGLVAAGEQRGAPEDPVGGRDPAVPAHRVRTDLYAAAIPQRGRLETDHLGDLAEPVSQGPVHSVQPTPTGKGGQPRQHRTVTHRKQKPLSRVNTTAHIQERQTIAQAQLHSQTSPGQDDPSSNSTIYIMSLVPAETRPMHIAQPAHPTPSTTPVLMASLRARPTSSRDVDGLSQTTCDGGTGGLGSTAPGVCARTHPKWSAVAAPSPRLGPSWGAAPCPLMNVAKYQVWVRSVRRVVRRRCRWQVDAIWRSRGGRREE